MREAVPALGVNRVIYAFKNGKLTIPTLLQKIKMDWTRIKEVARARIELATQGFSVLCSTD